MWLLRHVKAGDVGSYRNELLCPCRSFEVVKLGCYCSVLGDPGCSTTVILDGWGGGWMGGWMEDLSECVCVSVE